MERDSSSSSHSLEVEPLFKKQKTAGGYDLATLLRTSLYFATAERASSYCHVCMLSNSFMVSFCGNLQHSLCIECAARSADVKNPMKRDSRYPGASFRTQIKTSAECPTCRMSTVSFNIDVDPLPLYWHPTYDGERANQIKDPIATTIDARAFDQEGNLTPASLHAYLCPQPHLACVFCQLVSRNASEAQVHMLMCKARPLVCPHCSQFIRSNDLETHSANTCCKIRCCVVGCQTSGNWSQIKKHVRLHMSFCHPNPPKSIRLFRISDFKGIPKVYRTLTTNQAWVRTLSDQKLLRLQSLLTKYQAITDYLPVDASQPQSETEPESDSD